MSKPTSTTVAVAKATPHLGVTLATQYTTSGSHVRILSCHPADQVAKAGLGRGDIISHVDGAVVSDHETVLEMLSKLQNHSVTYTPFPEAVPTEVASSAAAKSTDQALMLTVPTLVCLLSIDITTGLAPVLAVGLWGWASHLLARRSLFIGRAVAFAAAFVSVFMVAAMGQEIRRCVAYICDGPTMYGTEADCRAPCSTTFGQYLHWPAIAATVAAALAAGYAAWKAQLAVEAHEAMMKQVEG